MARGGGAVCVEPSGVLAALPALQCLASFPCRPGTDCFPQCRETGWDTCGPSAAAPGLARASYRHDLVPHPALSSLLIPLLTLAQGWILFLPTWGGRGGSRGPRCTGACSAHARGKMLPVQPCSWLPPCRRGCSQASALPMRGTPMSSYPVAVLGKAGGHRGERRRCLGLTGVIRAAVAGL